MALVLNTNSYVEIDAADEYFETRIDSANWASTSDEVKEQALVTATQLVDNHPWIGSAVSSTQALAWPRKNATYDDYRLGMVMTVPSGEIPSMVKEAVYEQALHLIDNEDVMNQQTQTYESISIGSISLSDSNGDVGKLSITPSRVRKILKPLLRRGIGGAQGNTWWRAN